MKALRLISFCLSASLLIFLPSVNAGAADFSGRASTVLEWFSVPEGGNAVPLYQYLSLNIDEITDTGLLFRGYGRLAGDTRNKIDIDSRLYTAYLENKGLFNSRLDFRLGRSFVVTTAGASLMDGLALKINDIGPLDFRVFGGGDVKYHEIYSTGDLLVGFEAAGRFFNSLDLNLSYLQKWNNNDLANRLFGFDAAYEYKNLVNLYTEIQYSLLDRKITYFLGGLQYYPHLKWVFDLDYLYSLPVFSATSIYSVFAAKQYQAVTVELGYFILPELKAYFRFTREMYPEFADANVFEFGVNMIQHKNFSGYLAGTVRSTKEGQDLAGAKVRFAYWFTEYMQTGVGVHLDVFERRIEESDDTTSHRLWVDFSVFPTKSVSVQAILELVDSALWKRYTRTHIRLNVRF
ncbi:MAG: hypothetical protein V3V52_15575 [Candidatus Adiutricales bacterium]